MFYVFFYGVFLIFDRELCSRGPRNILLLGDLFQNFSSGDLFLDLFPWNISQQNHQNLQGFQKSKLPHIKNSKNQKFQKQKFQNLKIPKIKIPKIKNSKNQKFQKSKIPKIEILRTENSKKFLSNPLLAVMDFLNLVQLQKVEQGRRKVKRLEELNTGLYARLNKSWGAKSDFMYYDWQMLGGLKPPQFRRPCIDHPK